MAPKKKSTSKPASTSTKDDENRGLPKQKRDDQGNPIKDQWEADSGDDE